MGDTTRRLFGRGTFHLLWTVPLALLPGYLLASITRFSRCGIDRCAGDPGGFASPTTPVALFTSVVAGALLFAALAITPWLRPLWIRLSCAAFGGFALAGFWILGPTLHPVRMLRAARTLPRAAR